MKPGWIALALLAGLWPLFAQQSAQQYTISTIAGGAPPATPVAALGTSIGTPRRVAIDKAGNLYFSSLNSVFRVDSTGVLTLIAGNSRPGYTGDGGPAISATMNGPEGVAVDASGNVYISDTNNSVIRLVTPAGIISTFAGTSVPGYAGDYGPANQAQLAQPSGMVFDGSGNLFIADTGNSVIRKIATDGTITTFAGTGFQGYVGDSGLPTSAALSIPTDVFVDSKSNVYIADTGNNVIREVTSADGNIYTFAGSIPSTSANSSTVGIGDGAASTSAVLNAPRGVVVDSSGNVLIADFGNYRIRKATGNTLAPTVTQNLDGTTTITYNSNSTISTIAGSGSIGFSGDGNAATSAAMAGPWGIALDSSGNLYVADVFNYRVRKIASGGNISTFAGNGLLSYSGDGSAAAKAQLYAPRGVAVDAQGNLYIADTSNNRVRKVAPGGGAITTIAGTGTAGFGGDGSAGSSAQLNQPVAVALDSSGNLYIADFNNNRVRMVNPAGVISTVAGSGTAGFGGDGGPAATAQLNGPTALAVAPSGNVYVSDFTNNRVRKFMPGGNISTVAGNGLSGYGGDGGPATSAILNGPYGLAVDNAGNLYIADLNNSRIREVSPAGVINTIVGNGMAAVSGDGGPASQAHLAAPESLLLDGAGNLYIGDSVGRVRMISGGIIATVAGKGPAGYTGDGGDATIAQINGPFGLAVDSAGNLYIADTSNNAIRQVQRASSTMTITGVTNGASNASGPIAAGEVVTIYGTGLGPLQLAQSTPGADGRIPTSLAGTQILFNGVAAPILYTWVNQVGVIVPFGVTGTSARMVVEYNGRSSAPLSIAVAAAAPAPFTADFSGRGQVVANNADGSRNSAATPAAAGSVITLIATGGGQISPASADGSITPASASQGVPPQLVAPIGVTIGGRTALVSYAGSAPGIVEGVVQINATIPPGVEPGNAVPVVVTIGGVPSPSGLTIAVK